MFLSDISIKRPVLVIVVMAALLIFGIAAYLSIPLNFMPDAKLPFVTVTTVFAGASPDQIDSLITRKIEDEISSISGIKSIESYSLNSVSVMVLEFELKKNPDVASQEVKEKIDAIINDLPDAAETPVISKIDITATPILELVLTGDIDLTELTYIADTTLKDSIGRIDGVGSVEVEGGAEKEFRIEFDNQTIFENSLSLMQIAGILAQYNMDMPGGNFQNEGQDYSVALDGDFKSGNDLAELMIPTGAGLRRLDQLADIQETSENVRQRVTYFNPRVPDAGSNAVLVQIIKGSGGNAVEIAREVKDVLPELRAELPEGVSLSIVGDDSIYITDTVNDTLFNIILGIVLTSFVLLFFLHDIRSTLIVAIAMPLSIIPTFLVMKYIGITLNILSLMGLSTAVGVLVMNSVVVLENIFKHKSEGMDRKKSAAGGTAEVALAVFASTLTNICVFVPIGTMDGIIGVFLGDFAITIVIATIFSLLISLTLTPMMASRILPEKPKEKNKVSKLIEGFFKRLENGYAFLIEKVLHNKKSSILVIAGTLVVFVISMAGFTLIPFEFMPETDESEVRVLLEYPQDGSLEQTAESLRAVEEVIRGYEEVEYIVTTIGSHGSLKQGTNLAVMDLQLVNKADREDSSRILANRIGNDLTGIPNVKIRTTNPGMGDDSGDLAFYLQGDDLETLVRYGDIMGEKLRDVPGLTGVDIGLQQGKPEVIITPDRRKLIDMGITMQDLALGMRAAIDGMVMTQLRSGGREYDIRVTMADVEISNYESIRNIPITTPYGIYPLSFFAQVEIQNGINMLQRVDKGLTVEFTGSLLPGYITSEVSGEIDRIFAEMETDEVTLKWAGDADMMAETVRNMMIAFVTAVLLTYLLLAAILESFGQPLLILSTVPLALIGIVVIFLLTGLAMNMMSMLAIIMLVGMVVNNAILILEYSNQLRAKGMSVREALIKACPQKLQPILMANIATILGMLPMALGIGNSGAEMRQPMGLVSIGGLLTATFLTLFFIPALENALASKKKRAGAGFIGKIKEKLFKKSAGQDDITTTEKDLAHE